MSVVTNPEAAFRVVMRALSKELLAEVGVGGLALVHGFVESVEPQIEGGKITDFAFRLQGAPRPIRWSAIRSFRAGSHYVEKAR